MGPQLNSKKEIGLKVLDQLSCPWKLTESDFFEPVELARTEAAKLMAVSAENICFVTSTSYAISMAAQMVKAPVGRSLLILEGQFPSNVYTWRELGRRENRKILTIKKELGVSLTAAVLSKIDETVGLVALPQVHWTDGASLDLSLLSRKCREFGVKLVIDATQSLGASPLDIGDVQPDLLVASTYKWLLGVYGVAVVYVADPYLNSSPIEENWKNRKGSESFASLVEYQDDFQSGARRFDAGGLNHSSLAMVAESFRQINEWGVGRISSYTEEMTDHLAQGVTDLGYRVWPKEFRSNHILGVYAPKEGELISAAVVDSVQKAGICVSFRGESMRVSPHLYNSKKDLDRLLELL